jgi:hypothetical protein
MWQATFNLVGACAQIAAQPFRSLRSVFGGHSTALGRRRVSASTRPGDTTIGRLSFGASVTPRHWSQQKGFSRSDCFNAISI